MSNLRVSMLARYTVALAIAAVIPACGVNQVVPVSSGISEKRGASYYLPRTVIVATVPVKKTTKKKGDFDAYCLPLLCVDPAVTKEGAEFALGDEMTLEFAGERDPEQRFIAVYPQGPFKTFTQTLTLNDQGVLTKGDGSVENKAVEATVSTLEAASKIAGSVIKPASDAGIYPDVFGLEKLRLHINGLDDSSGSIDLTPAGLRVGLTVLLKDKPDHALQEMQKAQQGQGVQPQSEDAKALAEGVPNWKNFLTKSPNGVHEMIKATTAFKQLAAANESLGLTTIAADREALRAERRALIEQFAGAQKEYVWPGQFRWAPPTRQKGLVKGDLSTSTTLFSFHKTGGIASFNLRPEAKPKESLAGDGTEGNVSVVIACKSAVPEQTGDWQSLLEDRSKHGWHYRIPAKARVSLEVNGQERVQRPTFIAQHGCVAFVPATSFSQKVVSTVELDPVTGALKSAVHGGQSFDPGLISRSGNAIAGVIDAEKARQKADDAENDPLLKLTRKKNMLQLKSDIEKLEAAANP